jgi:hypothetical protein
VSHQEQLFPTPSDGPDVWAEAIKHAEEVNLGPSLIQRMRERRALGVERYGTPLQPGNGRDNLRDALEEALDLYAYLYAEWLTHPGEPKRAEALRAALRTLYLVHAIASGGKR